MRDLQVLADPQAVAQEAARLFSQIVGEAAAARRRCIAALAGGTTPALLHRALAAPPWRERISWEALHICWGDERCVPPAHPDSNYGAAWRDLLAHVPMPPAHIHRMAGEMEPAAAAAAYAGDLALLFDGECPRFDLILLGLGSDGHVASLFPGSPALLEATHPVANAVSPAGQARLTLTLPVLNAARHILFLVVGAAKAEIVARTLGAPARPLLPAQRVAPAEGTLTWLLDREAARLLA